jgi:hypothetical protein
MDKKVVVIVVLLLIAYFVFKSKHATAKPVTQGKPGDENKPAYEDENFIFWDATPYTIKKGDWLSKLAADYITTEGLTTEGQKLALMDFTKSLALFNGFNWGLYDNVATADKEDPDSLYIGQVISLPGSFASKKMYDIQK